MQGHLERIILLSSVTARATHSRTMPRGAGTTNSYCRSLSAVGKKVRHHSSGGSGLTDQQKLHRLHVSIVRGRLERDRSFINTIKDELTDVLSRATPPDKGTSRTITNLFHVLCHDHDFYDQAFFDSVSYVLLTSNSEDMYLCLLPTFLQLCSFKRYYPRPLLAHVGQFILDNVGRFDYKALDMIVTAHARLYHHLPQLVSKCEGQLLDSGDVWIERRLAWKLAHAGMLFRDYPKELLTVILNDNYIISTQGT